MMECRHGAMPKQERPRTVIKFSRTEVAEALAMYAGANGVAVPAGRMVAHGIEHDRDTQLCIERVEGQEVWPPEEAKR